MQVQVQLSKASYWRRRNENRNSESCCQQTTCDGRHRREFSSLTTSDRSWSPSWLPRATAKDTSLEHGPAAVGVVLGLTGKSGARRPAAPVRWHQDGRTTETSRRTRWPGKGPELPEPRRWPESEKTPWSGPTGCLDRMSQVSPKISLMHHVSGFI